MVLDTSMIISGKIPLSASERKTLEPFRLPSDLPSCSTFSAQRTSAKILWWCPPCNWGDSAKRRQMETKSLQDRNIWLWIHGAQEYTGPITRSGGQTGQRNKELLHYSYRFGIADVSTKLSLSWCQSKSIGKAFSLQLLTLSECRQFWLIF